MTSLATNVSTLKEFALPRLNKEAYKEYKELILNEKDSKVIEYSVKEFVYFYEKFLGFGSNIMHHVNDADTMFVLSDFYLPLSKNKFVLEKDFLPSPAMEALTNLFLVFSETNFKSYLLGLDLLFNNINPLQDLLDVVEVAKLDEELIGSFKKISINLLKTNQLIEKLQEYYDVISVDEEKKIQKDMCLLIDTFNILIKDLIVSEEKYKISIA